MQNQEVLLRDTPLSEVFRARMRERRMSQRALAARAGVDPGHLSRAFRGANGKTFSPRLALRLAQVLSLSTDGNPELREYEVIERIRHDAELRDRIYRQLRNAVVESNGSSAVGGDRHGT